MVDNTLKSQAFKLKGRLYTITVLQILDADNNLFRQQLADMVAKAPRMFDNTPVVLDCSSISDDNVNLHLLCKTMREAGLMPIGIQGGSPLLGVLAQSQGLALFNASSAHDKAWIEPAVAPTPVAAEIIASKLLTTPVRSGQQVVSKGGDLVITASVSHGAELLADGNIHIYGALRGRALAGIAGNKQARIFWQSLEAELVSIAGIYRLSDAIESMTVPCQIFIQDDRIQIEAL